MPERPGYPVKEGRPVKEGCPVKAAIEVLSGKWKVPILWHLSFGELRFAQLRKKLGTVSEKVLAEQLRQLEADGVLTRSASDSVPPAVTYSLNDAGRKLVPLMEDLCDWGSAHFRLKPSLPRRPAAAVN
jgi:DNA-binding HxlR family transcriptional regulator